MWRFLWRSAPQRFYLARLGGLSAVDGSKRFRRLALHRKVGEHATASCLRVIDSVVQRDFDVVASNVFSLFLQNCVVCSKVFNR